MRKYVDISKINQDLICSVCEQPFVNPYTILSCGHTFCETCFTVQEIDESELVLQNINISKPIVPLNNSFISDIIIFSCLICKNFFTSNHLFRNFFVSSCLEKFPIKCQYDSCIFNGNFEEVKKHEEICFYNNIDPVDFNDNKENNKKVINNQIEKLVSNEKDNKNENDTQNNVGCNKNSDCNEKLNYEDNNEIINKVDKNSNNLET